MKVFVIEDDPLMLRHWEDMLKRRGYQVMTAATVDDRPRTGRRTRSWRTS